MECLDFYIAQEILVEMKNANTMLGIIATITIINGIINVIKGINWFTGKICESSKLNVEKE